MGCCKDDKYNKIIQSVGECNECQEDCGCKFQLDTDCVIFNDVFQAIDVPSGGNATDIFKWIDNYIKELVIAINIENVGTGAEVYKGTNEFGTELFRTLKSKTSDLSISVNEDEVEFDVVKYFAELVGDNLFLKKRIAGTDEIVSTLNIGALDTNNYVNGVSLLNNKLILERVGLDNLELDLSIFATDKYLKTAVLNNKKLVLTMTDNTQIEVDFSDILVQSDYLERDKNSKSYIKNLNPSKTITSNYALTENDNNYVIVIDNGENDVVIDFGNVSVRDSYFVGFIQKGTGKVTFTNYSIKPDGYEAEMRGQGHMASVEIVENTKFLLGSLKAI